MLRYHHNADLGRLGFTRSYQISGFLDVLFEPRDHQLPRLSYIKVLLAGEET